MLLLNTLALEHTITKQMIGAIIKHARLRTYSQQTKGGTIAVIASIRTSLTKNKKYDAIAEFAAL